MVGLHPEYVRNIFSEPFFRSPSHSAFLKQFLIGHNLSEKVTVVGDSKSNFHGLLGCDLNQSSSELLWTSTYRSCDDGMADMEVRVIYQIYILTISLFSYAAEPVCRVLNINGFVVTIHRGDTVQLSCVVTLTGHCQPVMEWSLEDGTVIGRSASPDGNSEFRTVTLGSNFTVTSNWERISLTSTISLACPPNKFHFNDLSSINPEYKHVDNSFEIRILGWVYYLLFQQNYFYVLWNRCG